MWTRDPPQILAQPHPAPIHRPWLPYYCRSTPSIYPGPVCDRHNPTIRTDPPIPTPRAKRPQGRCLKHSSRWHTMAINTIARSAPHQHPPQLSNFPRPPNADHPLHSRPAPQCRTRPGLTAPPRHHPSPRQGHPTPRPVPAPPPRPTVSHWNIPPPDGFPCSTPPHPLTPPPSPQPQQLERV